MRRSSAVVGVVVGVAQDAAWERTRVLAVFHQHLAVDDHVMDAGLSIGSPPTCDRLRPRLLVVVIKREAGTHPDRTADASAMN